MVVVVVALGRGKVVVVKEERTVDFRFMSVFNMVCGCTNWDGTTRGAWNLGELYLSRA